MLLASHTSHRPNLPALYLHASGACNAVRTYRLPAPLWHSPSRFETAPIDRSSRPHKALLHVKKTLNLRPSAEKSRPWHSALHCPRHAPLWFAFFSFFAKKETRKASLGLLPRTRATPSRVQSVPCKGGASSTTNTATTATLTFVLWTCAGTCLVQSLPLQHRSVSPAARLAPPCTRYRYC